MGQLFIINDSFELTDTNIADRNNILRSFCDAFNLAWGNRDRFFGTHDFFSHQFSYGNLMSNLIYASWSTVRENENLKGVDAMTLSLIHATLMPFPNIISVQDSQATFLAQFDTGHLGNSGLKMDNPPAPFVYDHASWHEWKIKRWRVNQHEIIWSEEMDDFLPNSTFSNGIFLREIKNKVRLDAISKSTQVISESLINRLAGELIQSYSGNPCLAFYEMIMKKKGPEIEAYAQEIGGEVAEANFYIYDEQLTRAERQFAGSLRNIYRLTNRIGEAQYLSIDHRHGMFEYHDSKGTHLGEKKFDGSFNSAASANHNLKTLSQ